MLNYITQGEKQGAQVVTGGKKLEGLGYFVEPTILANVKDEMVVAKEEIFGPVMSVLKYHDEEE